MNDINELVSTLLELNNWKAVSMRVLRSVTGGFGVVLTIENLVISSADVDTMTSYADLYGFRVAYWVAEKNELGIDLEVKP